MKVYLLANFEYGEDIIGIYSSYDKALAIKKEIEENSYSGCDNYYHIREYEVR